MKSPTRYHPALVTLHWLMVVLVFINLYLGIFVFENRGGGQDFQMMNTLVMLHMAVGVAVLVLLIVRFVLRIKTTKPADATAGNKLLDILAKVVHYGLYLTILVVTVLGLVFSLQSGRFQSAFLGQRSQFDRPPGGFPNAQMTPRPGQTPQGGGNGGQPGVGNNGGGNPQGGPGGGQGRRGGPPGGPGFFALLIFHEWTAYLLLGLVALHILAGLYHQFTRKDNLLARMWYGPRE